MRAPPVAAASLAVGVLAVTPRSALATASAHLVYLRGPGAEQCAGEQALRGAVSARLGYDPFFAWARDTLFAEIQRSGGVFRAVVKLVDENNLQRGAREISVKGDDCSVVIDAIGLTISLTIDPSSVLGATAEPAPLPPAPRPSDEAPDPGLSPPLPAGEGIRPTPAFSRPLSLHAGAGVIGSVDAAPSPTAGANVFVGLGWRALSLDLEGRADYPATGTGNLVADSQVRSWLFAGSLVPCVHVGVAFGCAVVSLGALGASAKSLHPTDSYGLWSAAGGRLGIEWTPFGPPMSFRGSVELLGILTRDTLEVDANPVHRLGPWSPAVALAAVWRFQ
ncbi:MAG: hypothetical protein WBY94_15310 [Polyangiaceae bacterium]